MGTRPPLSDHPTQQSPMQPFKAIEFPDFRESTDTPAVNANQIEGDISDKLMVLLQEYNELLNREAEHRKGSQEQSTRLNKTATYFLDASEKLNEKLQSIELDDHNKRLLASIEAILNLTKDIYPDYEAESFYNGILVNILEALTNGDSKNTKTANKYELNNAVKKAEAKKQVLDQIIATPAPQRRPSGQQRTQGWSDQVPSGSNDDPPEFNQPNPRLDIQIDEQPNLPAGPPQLNQGPVEPPQGDRQKAGPARPPNQPQGQRPASKNKKVSFTPGQPIPPRQTTPPSHNPHQRIFRSDQDAIADRQALAENRKMHSQGTEFDQEMLKNIEYALHIAEPNDSIFQGMGPHEIAVINVIRAREAQTPSNPSALPGIAETTLHKQFMNDVKSILNARQQDLAPQYPGYWPFGRQKKNSELSALYEVQPNTIELKHPITSSLPSHILNSQLSSIFNANGNPHELNNLHSQLDHALELRRVCISPNDVVQLLGQNRMQTPNRDPLTNEVILRHQYLQVTKVLTSGLIPKTEHSPAIRMGGEREKALINKMIEIKFAYQNNMMSLHKSGLSKFVPPEVQKAHIKVMTDARNHVMQARPENPAVKAAIKAQRRPKGPTVDRPLLK